MNDLIALRRLVETYALAIDSRDPLLPADVFTPDGRLIVHKPDGTVGRERAGPQELARTLDQLTVFDRTFHLVGNHLAEVDGDTATGSEPPGCRCTSAGTRLPRPAEPGGAVTGSSRSAWAGEELDAAIALVREEARVAGRDPQDVELTSARPCRVPRRRSSGRKSAGPSGCCCPAPGTPPPSRRCWRRRPRPRRSCS
ncbi:nuclear transport factor 2 family protein [Streptomyces sp. NPDC058686]|uniref:nuclear transport factor 2 family protein n=1 Tax=Streptomyces sp. NPDC058686 TaxID=3346599 RepID=UPI003667A45B